MENVPVPPIAINPMTASDDELYHGVISDVNLLNSSAQSTDVDIDQDLYIPKDLLKPLIVSILLLPIRKNANNSADGF